MTDFSISSTFWYSAIFSVSAIFLTYVLHLVKNTFINPVPSKNVKTKPGKDKEHHQSGTAKAKKQKGNENKWLNKSEKQIFNHTWLLSSLKGHTDQILDMDYSSNGKYIVSSSEESSRGDRSSGSTTPEQLVPKGLTRRQRKNRRREENQTEPKKKQLCKKTDGKKSSANPLKQFVKLSLPENIVYEHLRCYILDGEEMFYLGYPVESPYHPGRAIIYKTPMFYSTTTKFDVNAREFVPEKPFPTINYNQIKSEWGLSHKKSNSLSSSVDSSQDFCSSDSNDSVDDKDSSKPQEDPTKTMQDLCDSAAFYVDDFPVFTGLKKNVQERLCVRCGTVFLVANNSYVHQDSCVYHWGKVQRTLVCKSNNKCTYDLVYTCCNREKGVMGCTTTKQHVWNGICSGYNGPFESYIRTKVRKQYPKDGNFGVYALDCEMCYTIEGLELAKVTVIGLDGRLVYDCLVKPDSAIIDYNTRFSGLTAKDLTRKHETKTLREVQNDLMGFINADTILIGHGLENDLRALKIMHNTIIDTSVVFPHYNGLPFKRSLKNLTSSYLKRDIQMSESGHNSYEDARACLDLMLWKLRKDLNC